MSKESFEEQPKNEQKIELVDEKITLAENLEALKEERVELNRLLQDPHSNNEDITKRMEYNKFLTTQKTVRLRELEGAISH